MAIKIKTCNLDDCFANGLKADIALHKV